VITDHDSFAALESNPHLSEKVSASQSRPVE
jgi:hypothetical protein